MARRADVQRVEAPKADVWRELVRLGSSELSRRTREASGETPDSNGDPEVGQSFTHRSGSGRRVCTITEIGHEDFVHMQCQFQGASGFIQHLAFVNGTVETDYEIKASKDADVTYVRAIADYTAPLWPTALAILFALGALIGMNTGGTAGAFVMGSVLAFWVIVGAAMQYLPRRFALKYVTGPVLERLTNVTASPRDSTPV